MRLFHFTCDCAASGVSRDGITLGSVLLDFSPIRLARGYQWMTVNPDPNQQTWVTPSGSPSLLGCDRTENRFTVEVPADADRSVLTLDQVFIAEASMSVRAVEALIESGRHEDWRIFRGTVPASWITEWWRRPSMKNGG